VSDQEAHAARQPNEGHLARVGHSQFHPTLRKAANRLATVHTPEGAPLPPNVSAGLQRGMARVGFVLNPIGEIEEARQKQFEQEPESGAKCREQGLARKRQRSGPCCLGGSLKLQRARSFRREVERANDDLDLLAVFGWLAFEEP
jgi:hypothetical protein